MDWQPIETAPADGQMIGWSKKHGLSIVDCDNWIERDGGIEYFNGDVYCLLTHWQPLPDPPQGA